MGAITRFTVRSITVRRIDDRKSTGPKGNCAFAGFEPEAIIRGNRDERHEMLLGICFIGLGVALLLGGVSLMSSANSVVHEILGAVTCFAAWGLAVWGMTLYRLAAIGKALGAIRASQEAKGKYRMGAIEPDPQIKTKATEGSAPSPPAP